MLRLLFGQKSPNKELKLAFSPKLGFFSLFCPWWHCWVSFFEGFTSQVKFPEGTDLGHYVVKGKRGNKIADEKSPALGGIQTHNLSDKSRVFPPLGSEPWPQLELALIFGVPAS